MNVVRLRSDSLACSASVSTNSHVGVWIFETEHVQNKAKQNIDSLKVGDRVSRYVSSTYRKV